MAVSDTPVRQDSSPAGSPPDIHGEVRDFAAKQNQSADAFLAAQNPPRNGEGDQPQAGGGVEAPTPEALAEAEAGMAEMSKVFRDTGSELYMGAGGREHD